MYYISPLERIVSHSGIGSGGGVCLGYVLLHSVILEFLVTIVRIRKIQRRYYSNTAEVSNVWDINESVPRLKSSVTGRLRLLSRFKRFEKSVLAKLLS